MTGGIDDHVIGDWVPHSPSTRTFFSEMLGSEDMSSKISDNELSSKSEGIFLGQGFGNTKDKNETRLEGDNNQLMGLGNFSEQKPSSRGGLVERMAARAGFNAPRLDTESIRSADLAMNNSSGTRSPYLTIPAGLSPTTLLESPVFLSNSLAQPSPTTGKFSFLHGGNSRSSETMNEAPDRSKDKFFEDIDQSPPFAFKPLAETGPSFFTGAGKMPTFPPQSGNSNQSRNMEPARANPNTGNNMSLQAGFSRSLNEKDNGMNPNAPDRRVFNNPVGGTADSPSLDEQPDEGDQQRGSVDSMCIGVGGAPPAEDGYNWRKYGQKQVKGSEYPRSYYKCTNPNCQVKKKVERSHEGHITEIIYKGAHNHPKPPPNRRSALGPSNPNEMQLDAPEQVGQRSGPDGGDSLWANTQNGAAEWKNDNVEVTSAVSGGREYPPTADVVDGSSNLSYDEDEDDRATHGSASLGYDGEGDESESKRRKIEAYATEMSGATRAIREPRVVVQTTSEVDILDDGYRWRKYGQKVVKGNPNPRSYYKCTSAGCGVRKHVERASHDLKSVITTYEGKHNHDVPAARNSSHANAGGASNNASTQSNGGQSHVHRAQPSQLHNGMARFERPPAFCSFALPGRQQLGPTPGFSFGMNQPGLANLAMAGLGPGQPKLPIMPVHPYLMQQQQQQHQQQMNGMGFMLPKGEPKMEPMTEPGLNISNNALYQQLMSRLPQM